MYALLEFWQKKIMAIPIMNPLSWFMIEQSLCLSNRVFSRIRCLTIHKCWSSCVLRTHHNNKVESMICNVTQMISVNKAVLQHYLNTFTKFFFF